MADETPETLRAEIDHHRRLAQLVTDAGVRAELERMIEELERRLRELEDRRAAPHHRWQPPNRLYGVDAGVSARTPSAPRHGAPNRL